MRFPFVKMHGTRNDFIVLDTRERSLGDLAGFARRACDRHSGIGADGVLAIESSAVADAKMRVINADGGEAEMCGNGIRCVARYLVESGASNLLRIETIGGIHSCETIVASGDWSVRVAIGEVTIERRALPFPDASAVVVGNPHVVLFADRLDAFDLREAQELLTREAGYVDGVNVHLAVVERD
ncbi:MAG TPA: diaminopimelate epimerase, partial [Candidatus Dormibacteraeota bacterium]|nr:diaminopimelate epimerase [Candidatus Dormibacteraeota bacterium]